MKKNILSVLFIGLIVCLCAAVIPTYGSEQKKQAGVGSKAEQLSPMQTPLIMADNQPITSIDYANFLQSNPTIVSKAASSEEGKKEAIRELIAVYLLRKAMYEEKLLVDPSRSPSNSEITEAYEKLAEKHFPLPPSPSDKEGLIYYRDHQNEYGIPDMVRLSQILFKYSRQADIQVREAAKKRAENALKRLEAGETFDEVAADVTENPIGKVVKGDIGYVVTSEQEWMHSGLKGMKVGERTGILESPDGYVILKITDTRPGLISPYANVRDKVLKTLKDAEQGKLRDKYINEIAKKSNIKVIDEGMKKLFPNGVFD